MKSRTTFREHDTETKSHDRRWLFFDVCFGIRWVSDESSEKSVSSSLLEPSQESEPRAWLYGFWTSGAIAVQTSIANTRD
jgi:hypothetical protein